jgi:hypothetical protein
MITGRNDRTAVSGVLLAVVIAACAPAPVRARVAGPYAAPPGMPGPPYFPTLFPNPTGENGYEDLVAAGDLLERRHNAAFLAAIAPDATLTQKRAALADPDCRHALMLVRTGLRKPMQSPRDPSQMRIDTPAPDVGMLRLIGWLLIVEQYVYLADGRTAAAVDSLRDSLQLGDAIRGEIFMADVVDMEIKTSDMDAFTCHAAQWSCADCDHILQIVRDETAANPDPDTAAFAATKRVVLLHIDETAARLQNADWETAVQSVYGLGAPEYAGLRTQWRATVADAPAYAALWAQVRQRVSDAYDLAIAQGPYGRQPVAASVASPVRAASNGEATAAAPSTASLADAIVDAITPDPARSRSWLGNQSTVPLRLLGAHAAIRRYRWEHSRLPQTLADVKMSDLTTNPYTGEPLDYVPTADGSGYRLTCPVPQDVPYDGPDLCTQLPQQGMAWQ